MEQDKPWSVVKAFGADGIPKGDAQREYRKLRDALQAIGIYLVPVGEIENFSRELGSHGPGSWRSSFRRALWATRTWASCGSSWNWSTRADRVEPSEGGLGHA